MAEACLVGAGIASLSAAALLIREGQFAGGDITILEARDRTGGSLDAAGGPDTGYTMRGGDLPHATTWCSPGAPRPVQRGGSAKSRP
ncbi:oleate hydratase [Streptomyces sp. NPDC060031]|uniref:oleate hydratase n=1 Tax=Streptomyces sp. NPDC060031 TaxID=3347043 RepID=UPI0036A32186